MPEISRRRLLGSMGGVAGATALTSVLPPNLRRALATEPRPGSLRDIKHIVVLMLENRSFDHYFGTLAGVRGFDDPKMLQLPNGRSVLYQPDAKNPDDYLLPFHLDTRTTSAQAIPSTSHAWTVQHEAWNGGRMDNWLPAHRKADGDDKGPYTMGYYTREDIPFHFALAESFTICDAYHCSVLGPTWPNRLYQWTGTIDPEGRNGGPIISNVVKSPYTWTTYPERLSAAGISWHVYQEEDDYGCNPLELFARYQDASTSSPLYQHGLTIGPADQFEFDAMHDRLPTISWIIPTSPQSEHPDYIPAAGADFLARKLDAVAANPDVWAKTVFILNYDENDGLFDHVPPPVPPPGTPDEFVDGLPIGAGIRVPCVIVSPWTQGGWVCSEPFDHTSVLRLMERLTGVTEPNISDWRRRTFGDLTSALGLPSGSRFPALPPTKPQLWQAEYDVAHLPQAKIPGKDQTPPHQGHDHGVRPRSTTAAPGVFGGSRAQTTSRLTETFTSHRADFPHGVAGTNFPGVLAAVAGKAAPTKAKHAYVPGIVSSTISVIDSTTSRLVSGIKAGTNPYGIAATPDGAKIYVTNSGASDVSVIDLSANSITSSVTVGLFPRGIAVSPDGRFAYVANTGPDTGSGGSRTVSVIDVTKDTVVATITVGLAPQGVAVTPDNASVYVTCYDGLWVIDTKAQRVKGHLTDLGQGHGVAIAPRSGHAYVTTPWTDQVSVVDTVHDRVVKTVAVGRTPWNTAIAPDGGRAYITNANSDTVSIIDTASLTVVDTVQVGHIPTGITAAADSVWVTNNASSTVTKIDTKTLKVVGTTELGLSAEPSGVVLV